MSISSSMLDDLAKAFHALHGEYLVDLDRWESATAEAKVTGLEDTVLRVAEVFHPVLEDDDAVTREIILTERRRWVHKALHTRCVTQAAKEAR